MRFRLRIPRFASSTVEAGPQGPRAVLDGSDVIVANRWKLPAHTVALVGRPAVWLSFDVHTPQLKVGPLSIPSLHLVWEQDFGGHLFVAITDADASRVMLIEAGPQTPTAPERSFRTRIPRTLSPNAGSWISSRS